MLDLAEWSYFWVGVQRTALASGTYVDGRQMYVEYWLPREVRHPYPIVLVHGGGGQPSQRRRLHRPRSRRRRRPDVRDEVETSLY